jgi:MoxR-like ATPase
MLATAARALAVLLGREFVIPDDVKTLVMPALRHRLVLSPGAEIEGITAESVLRQIVEQTPAPR